MSEGMPVSTSRFVTGLGNLLLCVVIGPIVGVCSIQCGKPLQNLAYIISNKLLICF